jgi:hypothetical protein
MIRKQLRTAGFTLELAPQRVIAERHVVPGARMEWSEPDFPLVSEQIARMRQEAEKGLEQAVGNDDEDADILAAPEQSQIKEIWNFPGGGH